MSQTLLSQNNIVISSPHDNTVAFKPVYFSRVTRTILKTGRKKVNQTLILLTGLFRDNDLKTTLLRLIDSCPQIGAAAFGAGLLTTSIQLTLFTVAVPVPVPVDSTLARGDMAASSQYSNTLLERGHGRLGKRVDMCSPK